MKTFLRFTAGALSAAAMVGCSQPENNSSIPKSIDVAGIVENQQLTPQNKAEELALAAEQLAQSSSFAYADTVLDLALQADSSNKRAQLYKAVLADKMALKGVLVRIKPLLRKYPKSVANYNKAVSELPNGALRTFLLDGTENISTEADVQNLLESMYEGREQLRNFLKANKDLEITLHLNDMLSVANARNCFYRQIEPYYYERSENCLKGDSMQVKMNRADIETLQQMVAGAQIYSTLATSYDLTGSMETAKKLEKSHASNQVVVNELSKHAEFGKVRNKKQLSNIVEMGMDAVAGIRWAAEMQHQLCPQGLSKKKRNQRPGYLFNEGVCINQQNGDTPLEEVLQQVELALGGGLFELKNKKDHTTTEVKLAAPLLNPVEDLKSLQPQFNACNQLVSTSDNTLGGVFPRGDANENIVSSKPCRVR